MSFSDLSFSSPRKEVHSEKSNDEDFERFMNESSFSEISLKNKKKNSSEPWWMTKDSSKIGSSMNSTKSFLKQSNKSKLSTQHENEEHFEASKKKADNFEEKYSIYDESFEQETTEHFSVKRASDLKPIERRLSKGEIQTLVGSHDSTFTVNDKDETRTSARINESSSRQDKSYSDNESSDMLTGRKSENIDSTLSQRKQDFKDKDEQDRQATLRTLENTKDDHLLSKVMFLDSMENGMTLNNQSSLKGINTATNDLNSSLGNKNPNRKMLKVQISEDRIEHRIQEESDEAISERNQRILQFKNDFANGRNDSISNFDYPSAKLDTQSMKEMEELEQYYRRNLIDNNTNTNTFNLNNNNNKSSSRLNNDINLTESLNEALKSQYERELELYKIKNEFPKNDSMRYSLLDTHSQVLLDSDLMENIKDELEKRALNAIMKDLTLSQEYKKKPMYSNNKYKHVKSSGYGKTTTKKSLDIKESQNSQNASKSYLSLEGLSTKDKSFIDNYITENMKLSNKISELIRERDEDRELLIRMKDEFLKREKEYSNNMLNMKLAYENEISKLKLELSEKSCQEALNNKNDEPEKSVSSFKNMDVSEQEKLIRGYQLENEKLYKELKEFKDNFKIKNQHLIIENEKLKIELANRSIEINNVKEKLDAKSNEELKVLRLKLKELEETNKKIEKDKEQVVAELIHSAANIKKKSADVKKLTFGEYFTVYQETINECLEKIDVRDKEIKRLSDKLKLLESSRDAPDNIKRIKELEKQLKQLENLHKRQRKVASAGNQEILASRLNNPDLLKIDYYEKKIENLEKTLNERVNDYELKNKVLTQKFDLLNNIYKEQLKEIGLNENNEHNLKKNREIVNNLESALDRIQKTYGSRLQFLEEENLKLKDCVMKMDEDKAEILKLNETIKNLKEANEKLQNDVKLITNSENVKRNFAKKEYEPNQFKENPQLNELSAASTKIILEENERLKAKLSDVQEALDARIKEINYVSKKKDEEIEAKLNLIKEAHKIEISRICKMLTGLDVDGNNIEQAIIQNTKMNMMKLNALVDEQKIVIVGLKKRAKEAEITKNNLKLCQEEINKLNEDNEKLKHDLHLARLHQSPKMIHYNMLKEKLSSIEEHFSNRSKELNNIVKNNATISKSNSLKNLSNEDEDSGQEDEDYEAVAKIQQLKRQLRLKDEEIIKFRCELDSILDVLETMRALKC